MKFLSIVVISFALLHIVGAQFAQFTPQSCPSCAQTNFDMVNIYRKELGIPVLSSNSRLTALAVAHSKAMFDTNNGRAVSDIRHYHSSWPGGENVAWSYNLYSLDQTGNAFFLWWLNSPPHRANMLRADYACLGVGNYGDGKLYMSTQVFGQASDC